MIVTVEPLRVIEDGGLFPGTAHVSLYSEKIEDGENLPPGMPPQAIITVAIGDPQDGDTHPVAFCFTYLGEDEWYDAEQISSDGTFAYSRNIHVLRFKCSSEDAPRIPERFKEMIERVGLSIFASRLAAKLVRQLRPEDVERFISEFIGIDMGQVTRSVGLIRAFSDAMFRSFDDAVRLGYTETAARILKMGLGKTIHDLGYK